MGAVYKIRMAKKDSSAGSELLVAPRGRQPDANSTSGKIRVLVAEGMKPMDIAKKLKCRPALVYNVKARMGGVVQKRGPGRPPKLSRGGASKSNSLDSFVEVVLRSARETERLKETVRKIQAILAELLG